MNFRAFTDVCAKLIIYQASTEGDIDLPKHLASPVHKPLLQSKHDEFAPRTMRSLPNALTFALKQLAPDIRNLGSTPRHSESKGERAHPMRDAFSPKRIPREVQMQQPEIDENTQRRIPPLCSTTRLNCLIGGVGAHSRGRATP